MAQLAALPGTGLKVPSVVRFDKIATLDRSVIAGKLGNAPLSWLVAQRDVFLGVFGFDVQLPSAPAQASNLS